MLDRSQLQLVSRAILRRAAVVLLLGAVTTTVSASSAQAVTDPVDDTSHVQWMVQSTGNLYATENDPGGYDGDGQSPATASILRFSKDIESYEHPRPLYSFETDGALHLDALTWAKVGSTWWGYVVANNPQARTSQIWRFSLSGDRPVALVARSPRYVGDRDLVADGGGVYWADEGGLRKAPVLGGNPSGLVDGTTIRHLGLGGGSLYYDTGRQVRRVQPDGSGDTLVRQTAKTISALSVTSSRLVWAQSDGSVEVYVAANGSSYTARGASPSTLVPSVFWSGAAAVWTECRTGQACQVRQRGRYLTTVAEGRALDLTGDSSTLFWLVRGEGVYRHGQ